MSDHICPYCYEEMDEPEIMNGAYVTPFHCYECGATEMDWRWREGTPRESRVGYYFGGVPTPDAYRIRTLTLKEFLEELVCHANSSSK